METIVITGSTRGIGFGLADAFLERGCGVTVSGRTPEAVKQAEEELAAKHAGASVLGHPCDVTRFEQVQALWSASKKHWGQIDIWINNAGIAHPQMAFWEHSPEQVKNVIDTNLIGAMHSAQVAIPAMLAQGSGRLFIMEGLGSDGRKVEGLTLYGTSKHALRYLTDALAREVQDTPVKVGALSPGMVMTDLITQQYAGRPEDWERAKRIFNILADRVETVTPWLAQQVLRDQKNGARIKWLTRRKIIGRFLASPFQRRDLFK
jgi:NAD(P)-dependent dehydrogenase (short-subunit alcohol dehydrogenase family)